MRSLRKLEHLLPPDADQVARIRNAERRGVARRERRTWHLRLVRIGLFLIAPISIVLLVLHLWSLRIVADGLARAHVVVTQAPSRVRVLEVFVEPGQAVRPGDPLLRLEALEHGAERQARVLALEEARLRLAVIEAGGDLGDADLTRRSERIEDATRRRELAGAAASVARAELDTLEAQRGELERSLEQERNERLEGIAALEARLAESRGRVDSRLAREALLEFDVRSAGSLAHQGVSAERAVVSSRSDLDASRAEVDASVLATLSVEDELLAAHVALVLEGSRGRSSLEFMDARLESARRELEAALLEQSLLGDLVRQRRELAPDQAVEGRALRELELELARTALMRTEAELEAFDRSVGQGLMRSEIEGRVDRVFVQPGAVVEAGEALVRAFDPEQLIVVAWVDPGRVDELQVGGRAKVFPARHGDPVEGVIRSIDEVWSLAPDQLPHLQRDRGSLLVPVLVGCSPEDRRGALAPNMRLQVVFRTVASTGPLRPAGL